MKLVIAEKPSVAQAIAKVLGANKRCEGYLEGNSYLISWCIGHLVELAEPELYNETYQKWQLNDLPILPNQWKYQVSASTKKQFNILKTLMNREDVKGIICATDAGREGELIFRLVYHQAQCKKTFERLWISSMEDEAIQNGFANLKPGTEYDSLYEAALCRERADWLVGMNATRLFSCLYGSTLNVGRVMTPTLAMVVMRDAEIKAFRSQPFYTVQLHIGDEVSTSRRFAEKDEAASVLAKCKEENKVLIKSVEQNEKTEKTPLLYDLTSLQRDANRLLGYTAQQTLDYAQGLYEKKLITYPRTDANHLTDDMRLLLPQLVNGVSGKYGIPNAQIDLEKHVGICCSKKVSDHHAIIPTKTMCNIDFTELPAGEETILKLISVRFLCALSDENRFSEERVVMTCAGEEFTQKTKRATKLGWKEIWNKFYPSKEKDDTKSTRSKYIPNSIIEPDSFSIKEGKTTSPKYFTEDTLLSAMENTGKEDFVEGLERKGIGTPATRAGIIEKLVQKGFIERKGDKKTKSLIPTSRGISLVTVMPEQICSAAMTAEWEEKLMLIEQGSYEAREFMNGITEMIDNLVDRYEVVKEEEAFKETSKRIGICPHCGGDVIERQKGWFCGKRECQFALWKDNAFFKSIGKNLTASVVERLLHDKQICLKDCKSKKTGQNFDAVLHLGTASDGKSIFHLEFDKNKE